MGFEKNKMYEEYIEDLQEYIDALEKKLELTIQVLTEIKDRDTSIFSKVAEGVLSEIEGES